MFRRICILLLGLTLGASVRGAVEPQVDPAMGKSLASRQRPTPPEPNTPAPPAGQTTETPGTGDTVRLQFPNSDVVDVLRYYEDLTGKKLVLDNNVVGKVNIFISGPVSREEAVRIIEMNLLLNGYTLLPAGEDIVKVIGPGKSPRGAGVPIISDEADIPEGDHVISYLFKLRYADPQELQQVLGQYLSGGTGQYTSFLALPKSSSILVTENSSVIRSLVKIIDQVDVAPAQVESEFIKLERADASKVVDMLKDIFEKGTQSNTPGFPRPGVRPVINAPPNQPQPDSDVGAVGALLGLSEDSVIVGKIKIAADVRTNRIHVITRPVNMPFVRKLIAEFDANVDFAKPVTRPLKYISASDMLDVLVQALSEPGSDQQGGQTAGNSNAAPGSTPFRNTGATGGTSYNSSTSQTASNDSLNVSEELSTNPVDTTPKAVTIGNAKIIADQRSNSIIILGNREVVVKVEKILDEMDVRAPQVALSTVIGELGLNNDEEFGVDYFLQFKNKNLKFPGTSSNIGAGGATGLTGAPVIDPAGLINFTQLATAAATGGANVYLSAGNTLSAIVHLLNSTGRFRTISRPMVFTSNNKKAIIASGQEIPVPVSTISSSTGGGIINTGLAQQSNIQFKKIALQLEVVPLINSDKEVSLDILQKLDSIAGTTTVDGNSIPTIATRYIRTNVSAPNGATIVLGGLIMDSKRRDTVGIPLLSRIPIIGSIFRDTRKSKMRSELIVLMRPEVTLTPLHQYQLRQKAEGKTHLGPEIDQDDCLDCPPTEDGKQIRGVSDKQLPAPDLPEDQ